MNEYVHLRLNEPVTARNSRFGVRGSKFIEHPIVGGCMMHISGPDFVAAISNAGALGMMASAMFPSQQEFRQAVRQCRAITDRPFGVNLSLFPALRPIDNDPCSTFHG